MSPPVIAQRYAGAENRFLLVEDAPPGVDWPTFARAACRERCFDGARPDGVLVLAPSAAADVAMAIYNADGSRPEACGNGLRCTGWHLARTRGLDAARVATDAGVRGVRVLSRAGDAAVLLAEMGRARELALRAPLPESSALAAAGYDLGNPHCLLVVADERAAPVERVGRALQAHPDFPRGVNVGFLAERDGAWHLRTFERGVGETEACGTNACAAAAWLRARDGRGTHELHVRGGVLRVSANEDDTLSLEGAAAWRGELLVPTRGADEGAWAT